MISARLALPARVAALAAATVLLLAVAADRASAYSKPPGGAWTFQLLFDYTRSGQFALTRDASRVAKLVLVPGEDFAEQCGSAAIALVSRPKVRSYSSANGRYAVAGKRGGLFVPTSMSFKRAGRRFTAKLMLLWDESGRLVSSGKFESGDCLLSFNARKR